MVALDRGTVEVLVVWRDAQAAERERWGDAWTDTVWFTREDGTGLHPDNITKQFVA